MTSEVELRPSAGEHSVPEHDAAGRLCGDMLRPDCGCVWSTRPEAQAQSTDVYNDDDEDDDAGLGWAGRLGDAHPRTPPTTTPH